MAQLTSFSPTQNSFFASTFRGKSRTGSRYELKSLNQLDCCVKLCTSFIHRSVTNSKLLPQTYGSNVTIEYKGWIKSSLHGLQWVIIIARYMISFGFGQQTNTTGTTQANSRKPQPTDEIFTIYQQNTCLLWLPCRQNLWRKWHGSGVYCIVPWWWLGQN